MEVRKWRQQKSTVVFEKSWLRKAGKAFCFVLFLQQWMIFEVSCTGKGEEDFWEGEIEGNRRKNS